MDECTLQRTSKTFKKLPNQNWRPLSISLSLPLDQNSNQARSVGRRHNCSFFAQNNIPATLSAQFCSSISTLGNFLLSWPQLLLFGVIGGNKRNNFISPATDQRICLIRAPLGINLSLYLFTKNFLSLSFFWRKNKKVFPASEIARQDLIWNAFGIVPQSSDSNSFLEHIKQLR